MVKLLGVSLEYVLWEMTWENLVLYSHACPVYGGGGWDERKDANDPCNSVGGDGLVTDPFV
jgi:hypothetical protein